MSFLAMEAGMRVSKSNQLFKLKSLLDWEEIRIGLAPLRQKKESLLLWL